MDILELLIKAKAFEEKVLLHWILYMRDRQPRETGDLDSQGIFSVQSLYM